MPSVFRLGDRPPSEVKIVDERVTTPFECVDPSVGSRLWQLQRPDLEPSLRSLLEAHVAACDACREIVQLDGKVRALVREGRLREPTPGFRRAVPIAALSLAASLIALVALPPRPISDAGPTRGAVVPRFLRPVEGEIVGTRRPALRWTPIDEATRYVVELRDGEGRTLWIGESEVPEIRVGDSAGLASGREYRALLSVRPADLAPPAPASVAFRSGSPGRMLLHRARWGHPWLQVATVLSLGLLAAAWLGRLRRREGDGA